MTNFKTGLLLFLSLLVYQCSAIADEAAWEKYNETGMTAYKQGHYAAAEKSWSAALKEAEKFGPQDKRLATSLNNLALLYSTQGKYAQAELYYAQGKADLARQARMRSDELDEELDEDWEE